MNAPRVLVVWCPDWPLIAAGTEPSSTAVVVSSGRVAACTAAARTAGVRRGQKLRDAQRYCPDVTVLEEDPEGETRAFEHVLSAIEDLCPRVEVVRPGLAAIPARGPSRYYGGEEAVASRVRDAVLERNFICAVGVADGVFAADLAARTAYDDHDGLCLVPSSKTSEFLAPHPVSALDMPDLAGILTRLGIRTLGDLAALPAHEVLSRFGSAGGTAHRLASGGQARPPAARPTEEDLSVHLDFDPPLDHSEPAVFAAKSLADQMHAKLGERGLACVRVEIEVNTTDGQTRSRLWRHDGLLSSLAVAERVRWQLDAWRTAGQLTGDLTHLLLTPDQVVVDTGRQLALWGQSEVNERVARAATRLQVMLGHAAVTRPQLAGGRGPGEQAARVPWGDSLTTASPANRPWPGRIPRPAPSTVHTQPQPVQVLDASGAHVTVSGRSAVSAPPARLVVSHASRKEELAITGWTGPWPVREYWWERSRHRRYARFQVITDDGRAWLLTVEQGRWWLEAAYT
ncbi:DNA polymerase Y family protein [Actinobacteria bacterium YIM 96077]|uniref:DNA polymerase Y family protein n=1 Tax=Phytoactinopolyspora halophila TaxID=1981511 RepID=A0A329QQZ1_9ACTN|nr:DNA polymerase Y family protein [Phytoactinopolyspora halophila]AYY12310.1 DNA polymerase Y family protein [Actinobacteria bacterium YIM 96077]RAW13772.1 DNA polymerase Y family protein [Phytoactinopolyspora halophila]